MRIPTGGDVTSRCVRAHEMMHAKVSPSTLWRPENARHLDDECLIAAEEFRVNMLAGAAGFPMAQHLADGSEERSGERAGINGDWNAAVLLLTATCGTRASRAVVRGVKRTRPDWVTQLRAIDRRLKAIWKRATAQGVQAVSSTVPWGEATRGWQFTLDIALYIDSMLARPPSALESAHSVGASTRGHFARPILMDLPLVTPIPGRVHRVHRSASTGRHPRHLDRLLTDPERRIFRHTSRRAGGVIVIDQSGSMRLTEEHMWSMIRAAPGCTIIGYSHEARSHSVPNIWVLAHRGRVVDCVPRGHGGNGVDGPALRYAASFHDRREPFIWICDGYVTDANDDHDAGLTRECAHLVRTLRIHQVSDIDEAVRALARSARGERLAVRSVGPVASLGA